MKATACKIALDTVNAALTLLGYTAGPIPTQAGRWSASIDSGVAADLACSGDGCDRVGMAYHPFHRGNEYRAFAVCDHCGHIDEI